MAENFNKGDVVRLKSGGPTMTVEDCVEGADGTITAIFCGWFDDKNVRQRDHFAPEALER